MAITATRLREQVTIQDKNLVDNGKGGRKRPDGEPEWLDIAEVWAEVIPLRGGEALSHAVLRSEQTYRVTIRARDDVTPALRLNWRGTGLNIKTATLSIDRADIVMTCTSGAPG